MRFEIRLFFAALLLLLLIAASCHSRSIAAEPNRTMESARMS